MASEDPTWKKDLINDLQLIDRDHTRETFPDADAAKRSYDRRLERTQGEYQKVLEERSKDEGRKLERTFRDKAENVLVQEERAQWPHAPSKEDKVVARLTISNRLDKLDGPNPPYRETPEYQEQSDRLLNLQRQRAAGLQDRIQDVRDQLNERFGFDRERRQVREDRGDSNDRSR